MTEPRDEQTPGDAAETPPGAATGGAMPAGPPSPEAQPVPPGVPDPPAEPVPPAVPDPPAEPVPPAVPVPDTEPVAPVQPGEPVSWVETAPAVQPVLPIEPVEAAPPAPPVPDPLTAPWPDVAAALAGGTAAEPTAPTGPDASEPHTVPEPHTAPEPIVPAEPAQPLPPFEPVPEPVPAPEPLPAPEPSPEPSPGPLPAPEPVPSPEPAPTEPVPVEPPPVPSVPEYDGTPPTAPPDPIAPSASAAATGEVEAEAAAMAGAGGTTEPVHVDVETTATVGSTDEEPAAKREKHGSFLRELPILLLIALVLAILLKTFLIQAFFIPSGSMEQTLQVRDRVLVNKLSYKFGEVKRGQIVVFNGLDSFTPEVVVPPPANRLESVRRKFSELVGLGQPGERDFIKRVIGLPGDTVACCTNGRVTVNGIELTEPYVFEDDHQPFGPEVVPEGKVWVMGDHRSRSSDSRQHGAVPVSRIVGRAFVVIWPFDHFERLPVPDEIEDADIPDRKPQSLGTPGSGYAGLPSAPWTLAAAPPALGLLGAVPLTALVRAARSRMSPRRATGHRRA